jgi:hypothetical protein
MMKYSISYMSLSVNSTKENSYPVSLDSDIEYRLAKEQLLKGIKSQHHSQQLEWLINGAYNIGYEHVWLDTTNECKRERSIK